MPLGNLTTWRHVALRSLSGMQLLVSSTGAASFLLPVGRFILLRT